MSDLDDTLDLWRKQNAVNHSLSAEVDQLHAEIAELRDGMVALSNRIEAVTRASVPPVPHRFAKGSALPSQHGTSSLLCALCKRHALDPIHAPSA